MVSGGKTMLVLLSHITDFFTSKKVAWDKTRQNWVNDKKGVFTGGSIQGISVYQHRGKGNKILSLRGLLVSSGGHREL